VRDAPLTPYRVGVAPNRRGNDDADRECGLSTDSNVLVQSLTFSLSFSKEHKLKLEL